MTAASATLRLRRERTLRSRAARGDAAAFAAVYERHHQALYRYCRSILRHEEDAQDALQSTMTRAFAALQDEQRDFELRPWLFRIAHNEAISILRRRRTTTELDDIPIPSELEDRVSEREELRLLAMDLADLPDKQRAALVLRELNGLSHAEIAVVLETSAANVKQTIYEARSALFSAREGREMPCHDVRRMLSDGDGRVLRGRGVRAHLRSCAGCRRFQADIAQRSKRLAMLAPPLPTAGAAALLAQILGGGGAAKLIACVAIAGGGATVAAVEFYKPPPRAAAEAPPATPRTRAPAATPIPTPTPTPETVLATGEDEPRRTGSGKPEGEPRERQAAKQRDKRKPERGARRPAADQRRPAAGEDRVAEQPQPTPDAKPETQAEEPPAKDKPKRERPAKGKPGQQRPAKGEPEQGQPAKGQPEKDKPEKGKPEKAEREKPVKPEKREKPQPPVASPAPTAQAVETPRPEPPGQAKKDRGDDDDRGQGHDEADDDDG